MNFQSWAIFWAVRAAEIFLKQFLSCEAIFLSRVRYLKFILGANSKNGAHLLNLMHRYTSPWMIKFRVSSQGDLQTSNDQIIIKVLPLRRILWKIFSIDTLISKKVKGTRRIYTYLNNTLVRAGLFRGLFLCCQSTPKKLLICFDLLWFLLITVHWIILYTVYVVASSNARY